MNQIYPDGTNPEEQQTDDSGVPASAIYYPPPPEEINNDIGSQNGSAAFLSNGTAMEIDGMSTVHVPGPNRPLPSPLPSEKKKKKNRKKSAVSHHNGSIKHLDDLGTGGNNQNTNGMVPNHLLYNDLPPITERRSKSRERIPTRKDLYDDDLPSKQAAHGPLGTALTRQQFKAERKKTHAGGNYGRHHATRDKMDANTIEEAQKRGLYIDSSTQEHPDELEQIKQLEIIRQMPVNLGVKRMLREKVLEVPTKDNSGGFCKTFCFQVKVNHMRRSRSCRMACLDFDHLITLWSGAFKRIEGHFGSGVLTYFMFLKWLFQLNCFIALVHFLFITLPMIIFNALEYDDNVTGTGPNVTAAVNLSVQCSAFYTVNSTSMWYEYILDFIQGSGYMEQSVLFYGYYVATELDISGVNYNYNMPLAYMTCVLIYFIVSLFVMVHITAQGFRERVFMNHGDFNQFANKVFGGWDFTLDDEKNGGLIHIALHREISSLLAEERARQRREDRSFAQECGVYSLRALIWTGVILTLAGAGYFIYWITIKQSELVTSADFQNYHVLVQLMIEYMTSVTITLLNAILPFIFKLVVELEDYPGGLKVNITLARTVFLKLASLVVLVISIYIDISCADKDACNVGQGACTTHRCWETYVGQEFYKLVIINLAVQFAVVFLIETPRRLVVDNCVNKATKLLGRQEFDIPKGVLDLIYMQAILWFGSFFCPLIPEMTAVIMLLMFYFKYFTCMFNYKPGNHTFHYSESSEFFLYTLLLAFIITTCPLIYLIFGYGSSEAQEFFLITLLITYTVCTVPLVYVIYMVSPSTGCGPFRIYTSMYEIIPITIDTWPNAIRKVVDFFRSAAVIVPLFIILCLVVYYLAQVLLTYKTMMKILKEQLTLEGRDKEFLLQKLRQIEEGGEDGTDSPKKPKSAKKKKPKSAAKTKTPASEYHDHDHESEAVNNTDSNIMRSDSNTDFFGGDHGHDNHPPGVPHDSPDANTANYDVNF